MAKTRELGRIFFRGNPWPKGHAVTQFTWTGRVERSSGIWFDLHLATDFYYADDPEPSDDDAEPRSRSDWTSKIVWCNSHACILSSTYWPGNGYGFLAGSKAERLDFASIARRTFAFDDHPKDFIRPPRPFNIYLTGHDAVSGHRVRFKREAASKTYTVTWSGKIALAYSGSTKFKYEFNAEVKGARFGGILIPGAISNQDARMLIEPFVTDHRAYRIQKTKDGLRITPT